ncbi:MAG: 50S ribosomal protein L6 [Clostridia bacterium]|nr:50S ribosomal protein L6 [Clostridia bacterium]
MSRIGRQPVDIPAGVTVKIEEDNTIVVKGPKGELKQKVNPVIKAEVKDNQILFTRPNDKKENRSMHGLYRALVNSLVIGVTQGFQKELQIVGVGYRAQAKGNNLELNMGYSHPVIMEAPEGITFETPSNTQIFVKGIDKQLVGQVAANIRAVRKPEPYLGKGIRYAGEYVRRKEGKAASK